MGTGFLTLSTTGLTSAAVVTHARLILWDATGAGAAFQDADLTAFALEFLRLICSRRADLRLGEDGTLVPADDVTFDTVTVPLHLLTPLADFAAGRALQMDNANTQNLQKGQALIERAYAAIQ
jgi:hypothetical protein